MKKYLSLLLALVLVLSLCACGGGSNEPTTPAGNTPTEPTDPSNPTDPTDPVDDGLTEYVITVVDAEGNPIAGAFVQICTDHGCIPFDDFTGADGKASKRAQADTYKAMLGYIPEGSVNGDAAD